VSFVPFRDGTLGAAALVSRRRAAGMHGEKAAKCQTGCRPAGRLAGGRFPRIQSPAMRARTMRATRVARGGSVCRAVCPFDELITPTAQLSARLWVALPAIKLAARKLLPDRRDYSVGAITRVECARDCFPYVKIRDVSSRGQTGGRRIHIFAQCRRGTIAAASLPARSNRYPITLDARRARTAEGRLREKRVIAGRLV